jgi:hypothetical protein
MCDEVGSVWAGPEGSLCVLREGAPGMVSRLVSRWRVDS